MTPPPAPVPATPAPAPLPVIKESATRFVELLRVPGSGAPGPAATHAEVAAALEDVVDPCSLAQGTPLSLPAMGLVRGWRHHPDGVLELDVCVTAPGCTFVGVFADAAARALAGLPGVREVAVRLDPGVLWHEGELRGDAAATLRAARDQGRPDPGRPTAGRERPAVVPAARRRQP